MQSGTIGDFGFYPQVSKGAAPSAVEYYWYQANMAAPAPNQLVRNIGPLVGGSFLVGPSTKTAAWAAGQAIVPPALEDNIGWLFYTFAGGMSTTDNTDGTYTHTFPASGADTVAPEKYMAVRRILPEDGGTKFGETMLDNKIVRLVFGCAPGEYMSLQADFLGRSFESTRTVTGTGWTPAYEDLATVPIVAKGKFELPDGTALGNATGITVEMVNVVPDLRQMLVAASYYPADWPVLTRALTVTWTALWEDADLYESVYYDSADGSWNPVVYTTDLDMEFETPGDDYGTGTDLPMKLGFFANKIEWTARPVELEGGALLGLQMTGTVIDNSAGAEWSMTLTNEQATYTWPT